MYKRLWYSNQIRVLSSCSQQIWAPSSNTRQVKVFCSCNQWMVFISCTQEMMLLSSCITHHVLVHVMDSFVMVLCSYTQEIMVVSSCGQQAMMLISFTKQMGLLNSTGEDAQLKWSTGEDARLMFWTDGVAPQPYGLQFACSAHVLNRWGWSVFVVYRWCAQLMGSISGVAELTYSTGEGAYLMLSTCMWGV